MAHQGLVAPTSLDWVAFFKWWLVAMTIMDNIEALAAGDFLMGGVHLIWLQLIVPWVAAVGWLHGLCLCLISSISTLLLQAKAIVTAIKALISSPW